MKAKLIRINLDHTDEELDAMSALNSGFPILDYYDLPETTEQDIKDIIKYNSGRVIPGLERWFE
ncbi:MAG: hypothetical protein LBL97_03300 [Prevotellaceae bacterium]|jgi:hypothetical protein|nr:hypothetical protein [Prevotellaceae bacterium]